MLRLEEFIRTGKVDCFGIDSSIEEILGILGTPEEYMVNGKEIAIYKYGELEFTSKRDKIKQIKFSLIDVREEGSFDSSGDNYVASISVMSFEEMLNLLDSLDIGWQVNERWTMSRQVCISTDSKVNIFYNLNLRCFDHLSISKS